MTKKEPKNKLEALAQERKYLIEIDKLRQEQDVLIRRNIEIENIINKEEELAFSTKGNREQSKIRINDLKAEQIRIQERMDDIYIRINDFERKIASESRNFDKYRCIENIRELLKNSDIRIGQIEKEAGCTPGYLSRLEKEGNRSDPSMEFLCTAAKMLNVTLDSLVKGKLNEITKTEQYLLDFISKLVKDTKSDSLVWEKESVNMLRNVIFYLDKNGLATTHPLFDVYEELLDGEYPEPAGTEYKSRFLDGTNVTPYGDCYNAKLPGVQERIYIMSVFSDEQPTKEIFELYLIGNKVNPICCTLQTCESIAAAIKDLYKEIEVSAAHVHISDYTRNIITKYMNGSSEELPFV